VSSRLLPCSRSEFIRKLRALGYDGPYPAGKHQYMARVGHATVRVPNPHAGDISVGLLSHILKSAGISREEWMKV
jgi:predicted RNA binding protein YcfA (HicA-like mRNA interferase family)